MTAIKEKVDRKNWKPKLLQKSKLNQELKAHIKRGAGIIDQYDPMLEEVFLLRHPRYRYDKEYAAHLKEFKAKHYKDHSVQAGNWFYYPWLNQVIHFLPDKMHQELRTARNRFLITAEEQEKFYNAKIGVMGMSVGSHVALTIAMTGGAKEIKLADPDELSGSNLNRIRTGFQNIGLSKTIAVARQICEMNPYAKVTIFEQGVTEQNLDKFISDLDLIVEEMDNPFLKIQARVLARKYRIPLIMGADNGDNIIVDVERYDLEKNRPLLHGILGNISLEALKKVQPRDLPHVIAKMAGADRATLRMLESVLEVGKTIYSWPQLGNAATLCGTTLTYLARKIIIGDRVNSGRYDVDLDMIFAGESKAQKASTDKKRKQYLKKMGLI
jgi:molybdopterin/thiamine biosynthesis adenylyltransferase